MVVKERDEELTLFLEMRRREKENEKTEPFQNSDASLVPPRKTAADNFLNSENDKSDYDWLLTPPGTPLLPSLEKESLVNQIAVPNSCPTALKPRLANLTEEPASKGTLVPKRPTSLSRQNSSNTSNGRPLSTGGQKSLSRPATPTGRPTLATTVKPKRPSTPSPRGTLPSATSNKPGTSTARSSTPSRSTPRSSTPTSRSSAPSSKSTSRSATPTCQPVSSSASAAPVLPSSSIKAVPTTMNNPAPAQGISPAVKSRPWKPSPWKPSQMPGFSLDAPPNLRTSLPERPASASRGRPGGHMVRSSVVQPDSNGKPRRQSCSPCRGRTSSSNAYSIGNSNRSMYRTDANSSDNESPVVIGTKMVERVVNMRKLTPRKQEDKFSGRNNPPGKLSSSIDGSGFGRTLSKTSLDMAMRHMDIRLSISGNARSPVNVINVPASTVYTSRSGSTKSTKPGGSASPIATDSNAMQAPNQVSTTIPFA